MRREVSIKLFKKYTKTTKHLVEICDVAKGVDSELSTQSYLSDFDKILQSVLFFQSKSNKAIYPKEINFIDDLTEHGDVLQLAKQALAGDGVNTDGIDWHNVFCCDKDILDKLSDKIQELTKSNTKNLVAYVALAECLDGKNHFAKLSEEMVDLIYYFAKLENGIDDNEVRHGIMAYCHLVVDYYVEVTSNIEEFFQDKQIKKDLLSSLRKEYRYIKRGRHIEFIDKHIQAVKDRISSIFNKDDE